jgi:hypothetical protein
MFISAQKKNNTGTKSTNTGTGDVTGQKELTNALLQKFSATEKVEFFNLKDAFEKPEEVTSLKLNKQGLTEIPDLSAFKNLSELDLSDNEITDFSSRLRSLTNLQVLNLSGNKLTIIPEDICSLKNLVTLNLSSNKISAGSVSCLSNLERVFLNSNELTTVPAGLTDIQSLKGIYLQSNKLTTVPEGLAKLPNLEVLFLQFNKIIIEPEAFRHTGIMHYMFYPQSINSRYLYKYVSANGSYSVIATETNQLSSQTQNNWMSGQQFDQGQKTSSKKWYLASRASVGIGAHKVLKDDDFMLFPGRFSGNELELGINRSGFGVYYSKTVVYPNSPNKAEITKIGAFYRYFFADISARARPYVKGGLGLNLETVYWDSDDSVTLELYKPINIQARAGVDFYVNRFLGFNIETGFGAANRVSFGLIFRFIKKSYLLNA